ncbi:efflux RND transporter periplasmic adaptor subunit [Pelotomaculum terephthalicicum JT]|uniref:efflux RND transporter periplasmic adaptor subunit n=1 Tax=Pelotomaculum TaxID=191373 RepID=UPI0009CB8B1C|nr:MULTISPECIES: efflux RND transporter periplasmic adaptor subunit [Pelotomaculum]MCG9968702.1 efflux RND transporter periplasmic adaptor subunit [Pelotomaculum terephthalicicum JT]OPX86989.1 MAG: Macrolide export protein MacA [Pelotomaculum sp. PtaB.Bin117]
MKRLAILVLALLLLSFLNGCGSKQPAGDEIPAIAVEVVSAGRTDMNKIYDASGQIKASAEATIAPKVAGRVTQVNVKLGDRVGKGQTLFQIDAKEARSQLAQLQADLGISQVSYDTAVQALKDAQSNYDRTNILYESGAVSKTDLEQATTKLVNAQLSLEQSRQQIDKLQVTISTAQDNLNDYTVAAPIDGFIGAIKVETGEMVSSQTDAAVIVNIDTVKVEASVPESVVNAVQTGSNVPVTIDSLNKSVAGTVTAIAPKADSTTMGYPVEITIANPTGEIKPGMTVKIDLFTGTLPNVVAVPVDAVIEKDGQHIVYVVEDDKAREVYVEIGVSNDSQTEITEGLEEGQIVVVQGNRLLSDGQQVKVVTGQEGGSQ